MTTSVASPARILVADDQPDVLEALCWLLAREGYALEFASSPAAALERLRNGSFDLLLMDLNYNRDTTSGGEGLELIRSAHALDACLPIVAMTGWGSVEIAVEAMRLGARTFVQKPWENATLVEMLAREISDARAIRHSEASRQREAEDARVIQRGLLPTTPPQIPGIQLASWWRPASGIGGDCFDMLTFGAAGMGISVADVAGKGLAAALLMSNLQGAVRAFAQDGAAPGGICASVNRLLCRNMASGRFVTFCYVHIDRAAGTLKYSNAGHNPPLLIRRTGTVEKLSAGGMVLGVFERSLYEEGEATLIPGDRLVLYTDGITETRNARDEELCEAGLLQSARRHRTKNADEMLASMLHDVEAYNGGVYEDDATLIVGAV